MTQKFGRNYKLTIDPQDGQGPIIIEPPFTMRFWVKRDLLSSSNSASIDVYNLSRANRKRIFQDRFNFGPVVVNGANLGPRTAKLDVGYGDALSTIWQGQLLIASSAREGVDIVTRIESLAQQYDVAASTINQTLPAGTTLTQVFKTLIAAYPTLQYGYVSDFTKVFTSPVVLNGKPWDLLNSYAQNTGQGPAKVFADNGKAYVMLGTDLLGGGGAPIPLLSAATGLLETPRREQSYLSVVTLMEPSIQANSIVQVNSVVEPSFNGQYSVIGLQHNGTISAAVSGDCRSTFMLLAADFLKYNLVQGA